MLAPVYLSRAKEVITAQNTEAVMITQFAFCCARIAWYVIAAGVTGTAPAAIAAALLGLSDLLLTFKILFLLTS